MLLANWATTSCTPLIACNIYQIFLSLSSYTPYSLASYPDIYRPLYTNFPLLSAIRTRRSPLSASSVLYFPHTNILCIAHVSRSSGAERESPKIVSTVRPLFGLK